MCEHNALMLRLPSMTLDWSLLVVPGGDVQKGRKIFTPSSRIATTDSVEGGGACGGGDGGMSVRADRG